MYVPAKGAKRRLGFFPLIVVWSLKSIGGLVAFIDPKTPKYLDAIGAHPYMGDLESYVVFPVVLALLNVLMFAFARTIPKWLAIVVVVLQIILLLVLLFAASGGV
jgi:hypothetical protein